MLHNKPIFTADIIAIRHFYLKDINDFVAGLDTGYNAHECRKMIQTMYKNSKIDWEKRMLSLILLRRNKNASIQSKTQTEAEASA